ncbi:hypothetical protein M501DRAFT_1017080 [Patellaria atrata CBS 101060]|uniref:Uncharacterized protein n=1 Tax=Patellaria atrata CBS 101060 TaxID=1346257 RepID=A0A9P4VQQ5_9PEZI|nr:hypothetical protein M501DRAFT_1017080 [Patellaria atrata CBS 101060]
MTSSAAVNVPTNNAIKEKDINTKLQLYGIFSAFSNGKVPSNKQIDVALNSALESKALGKPSNKLSAEGQKLVADVREVIEQAKILLLTKNEGNLLQDFIWQTQQVNSGTASTPNAPVDKETAKQHGNEALEGLRTLGTLIISNGQFRKLLNDAAILLRSIAGDAATKAANKVNPGEDQLRQIDEPAEDNTWHDVPHRADLKQQAKDQFNKQKPFDKEDLDRAAGNATQTAHPEGSRDPAEAADLAARQRQQGQTPNLDAQQGARAGIDTLREAAHEKFPEDTKDKGRDVKNRTHNYLKDKMPEERRDQTIWRLKKMVVEIQGHQDYLQAIDTLLRLAEEYTGHGQNLAQQGSETVKGAHTGNDPLHKAEADLRTLLERFANSTSFDDLFESIDQIYRDADRDPDLKNWFKRLDHYIRKVLKEQGYIMQDQATDEWNDIYDQGHFLLRDRYRNHTDRILDEFKFIGNQFDEDPQNTALANAVNKLFKDLGNDENGNATFKPHLLKDISDVILPAVFENIRYVPIPRIEYTDPQFDAIVENLVIEGDNLAPNVLEFGSDNYWRWGRKKITSKNKNKVMLSVSGVQCDLRDVSYYVKRKQGFPSITDKGVVDVYLGGQGFSFKVEMETADSSDNAHFFKVDKVSVDVKHPNIKVKKSNHKLLFSLFKPLLLKVIRPVIEKVLEKQIKDNIHQLDGILFEVKKEVDRAEADFKRNPSPENAQNIYQRYLSAANQQIMKGKQKKEEAKEAVADKKVNMAVTQHDSMFKHIELPGGISTKATEYKELAAKGDKWESPVFSIGSAKESSNLPSVRQVQRKPHNVTSGGVRGGSNLDDSHSNFAGAKPNNAQGQSIGTTSSGFANQVDQSFDSRGQDYSLKGVDNTHTNGSATNGKPQGGTGTLLGANNPVLSGNV